MKFPPTGTWVKIAWQDAQCEPKWSYDDDKGEVVVEITSGMFRGIDDEGRVIIAPTISAGLESGELHGKLAETGIPVGCVLRVIKDPPVDLKLIKVAVRPQRARKAKT
jgi:hypothetical protein